MGNKIKIAVFVLIVGGCSVFSYQSGINKERAAWATKENEALKKAREEFEKELKAAEVNRETWRQKALDLQKQLKEMEPVKDEEIETVIAAANCSHFGDDAYSLWLEITKAPGGI